MGGFELHRQLEKDTFYVASLMLSELRLMDDSGFPWLILVPRVIGAKEIFELGREEKELLIDEISAVSEAVNKLYKPDKINIGALGNIVPQLHIHIIGRYKNDRAWPGPAWGSAPRQKYTDKEANASITQLIKTIQQS